MTEQEISKYITRRGNSELAGTFCHYDDITGNESFCGRYARYQCTGMNLVMGACGAHLPVVVRHIWTQETVAVTVQEVPGAWR